jgi:hypothetical protein
MHINEDNGVHCLHEIEMLQFRLSSTLLNIYARQPWTSTCDDSRNSLPFGSSNLIDIPFYQHLTNFMFIKDRIQLSNV